MADDDLDGIEDIFTKELERLLAAKEEEEILPPEEPESMADAFAIGTIEPTSMPPSPPSTDSLLVPPGPPAVDPLLAQLGPPAAPPVGATPPAPPASPPEAVETPQPAFAPPPGAFGAPPGPPPSGPPASPPGPPAAPPMDATPPGPPASSIDLLTASLTMGEEIPPSPPASSLDAFSSPTPLGPPVESPTAHFAPPEPIAPTEPTFDKVDIESWDSNWNEDWNEKADVFETADPKHSPAAIQDDVEWDAQSEDAPDSNDQDSLPSKAALNKMKKAMLVELAKLRNVSSSGTKVDIIQRLLS